MFLPLRRYAEFSGRSRRKEYWLYTLGIFILYLLFFAAIIALVGAAVISGGGSDLPSMGASLGGMIVLVLVMVLLIFILFIPSLAVSVRRLHDIDLSGHWVWIMWGPNLAGLVAQPFEPTVAAVLSVVSLLGWLALLILAMLDGTRGPNRFGEDPKGGGVAEVFA